MDWWQVILIILGSIVMGLLAGYLISYLVVTLILKEPFKEPFQEPFKDFFSNRSVATTVVAEKPMVSITSDLVAEIESNLKIATEPWSGGVQSFQTNAWDTSGDRVNKLPANLRDDLTQAYVDIRLVNSIVWLATELGRRSPGLDENYRRLCANIAARLNRVTPLLKKNAI